MMPDHNSDEASMLFVGAYLCKLSFPIIYNYLNMGGLGNVQNGDYSDSPVFIQYFGPAVNMTPLLGEGYNDWVSFLILIVSVIFASRIHFRIASIFEFSNSFFDQDLNSGNDEGRQLLENARSMEIRRLQREGVSQPSALGSRSQRPRNAGDFLARYRKSESDESTGSTSQSSRLFGAKAKKSTGYQRLDG